MIALFALMPVAVWDFGTDAQGLLAEGDTLQWAWSGAPEEGPGGPSWGTNPDGQYLHDADDSVVLVLPSLAGLTSPTLLVDHSFDVAMGDQALVEIDDGKGWVSLAPAGGYPHPDGFVGSSGGWVRHAFELAGLGDDLRVRFRLVADDSLADDGWYLQRLELFDGDVSAPTIRPTVVPADNQGVGDAQSFLLQIDDTVAVEQPTLSWFTDVDPTVRETAMVRTDGPSGQGGSYAAEVPGLPADTVVHWFVTASDGTQLARYPAEGEESFRVFLAAPTALDFVTEAPRVATEVSVAWEPPTSPHGVVGYELWHDDELAHTTTDTRATVPLDPGRAPLLSVRADYGELGVGDASVPLFLDLEVPQLTSVSPSEVFAGSTTWIGLSVQGLYLLDGDVEVALGEGVAVETIRVLDTETAQLLVTVDDEAEVGARDLTVAAPHVVADFPDAFVIGDRADAPRILSVDPSSLVQGQEATLTVRASEAFGEPVVAVGDDGLVVTRGPQPDTADPGTLTLTVAAQRSAPLGQHELLLDDGRQLWTVPVDITEYRVPPAKNCAVGAPGLGPWWAALMITLVLRRRSAR